MATEIAVEIICPEIRVHSYVSNTKDIEQKLLRAELDVGVVEGEILFLSPAIHELERLLHTYENIELPPEMGILE